MSGKATNSGEANEKAQSVLILPEHAACAGENCSPDAFNLEAKLGRLLRALQAKSTQPPLAVALTGDWGTGKSSAMHWLRAELETEPAPGQPSFKTCTFKPWKFQTREAVLSGLLTVVISAIRPNGGLLAKTGAGAVAVIDGILHLIKSVKSAEGIEFGSQGGSRSAAKQGKETYQAILEPERLYSNAFEVALRDALKKDLGEDNRLVIFIDDLDRCLPEVAIQVLEAMKLFFDQAQVIFILGVDRDVIDRMMVRHYLDALKPTSIQEQAHVARKARQYLDKMFQIEVQVPPTDMQIQEFAETQVSRIQGWDKLKDSHKQRLVAAIRAVAGINPRGVIRALNSAFIGAGSVLEQIDLKIRELEELDSYKGAKDLAEEDASTQLEVLKTQLAQAVQLRLVEAVLTGSEVAAIAANSTFGESEFEEGEFLRVEDWHALTRHASGREFLHAWSIAVQGDAAQYLRHEQIHSALLQPEAAVNEPGLRLSTEAVEELRGQKVKGRRSGTEEPFASRLKPLVEVARRFPSMSPLLGVSALGVALSVVEFASSSIATSSSLLTADMEIRRLAVAVARAYQIDVSTIVTNDLKVASALSLIDAKASDEELIGVRHLNFLEEFFADGRMLTRVPQFAKPELMRSLELLDTSISEIGDLAFMTNLETLDLMFTTTADVAPIGRLKNLKSLCLRAVLATEFGCLQDLGLLERLDLRDTNFDEVEILDKLESLKVLELRGTRISKTPNFKADSNLEYLGLACCQVFDIASIAYLKALKRLDLQNTRVSDVGDLVGLKKLMSLNLAGTPVRRVSPLKGSNYSLLQVVLPDGSIWYPNREDVPKGWD